MLKLVTHSNSKNLVAMLNAVLATNAETGYAIMWERKCVEEDHAAVWAIQWKNPTVMDHVARTATSATPQLAVNRSHPFPAPLAHLPLLAPVRHSLLTIPIATDSVFSIARNVTRKIRITSSARRLFTPAPLEPATAANVQRLANSNQILASAKDYAKRKKSNVIRVGVV